MTAREAKGHGDFVAPAPAPAASSEFEAAVAHHRAGRLDEAEGLYRGLLDVAPDHPRVLHMLGVIESQRGRHERGAELIERAFPALAKSPEFHVDHGNALRQAGKREEAAESYRRAIALHPDYALAHMFLGSVLNELGRFEAAMSHCRTAIAIDAKSIPARITLAVALRGAGRMPEAAATWREIIKLEPKRAQSYYQFAVHLSELGLFNEAVDCTDRAIALQPKPSSSIACGAVLSRTCTNAQVPAQLLVGPRPCLRIRGTDGRAQSTAMSACSTPASPSPPPGAENQSRTETCLHLLRRPAQPGHQQQLLSLWCRRPPRPGSDFLALP